MKVQYLWLLLAVLTAIAVTGCTSSPAGTVNQTSTGRDMYAAAYNAGLDHHYLGECSFNNGTVAWESQNYRQAISDYANASKEYDAAAALYEQMGKYAANDQEKGFSESLKQCSVNLSRAAGDFMEASISLQANDLGKAETRFNKGMDEVNASDVMLNQSLYQAPEWMHGSSNTQT